MASPRIANIQLVAHYHSVKWLVEAQAKVRSIN